MYISTGHSLVDKSDKSKTAMFSTSSLPWNVDVSQAAIPEDENLVQPSKPISKRLNGGSFYVTVRI